MSQDLEILRAAFKKVFSVEPRQFGRKSSSNQGYSDNVKGVQWNVGIVSETDNIQLGVNLEGLSYNNAWPISKLLQNELNDNTLFNLFHEHEEVTLQFVRDAWQVTARLPIEEELLLQGKLSSIEKARWISSLHEGLGCLNQLKNYKGRERQIVTLISSGMKVERQVTPHISFKIEVVPKNMTVEELSAALMFAQTKLVSIHNHISSVTE